MREYLSKMGYIIGAISILGSTALAGPAPAARASLACSMSGNAMTLTLSAKTKGGGKPQGITEAAPVFLIVDQKVDRRYSQILGMAMRFETIKLPVTATFNMCSDAGSMVAGDASAIRGRGIAFVADVGFVTATCSPKKPPSCQ